MNTIDLYLPGKPNEKMLLRYLDKESIIAGLILRGTLPAKTDKHRHPELDIEYEPGEMIVSGSMTGELIVTCLF